MNDHNSTDQSDQLVLAREAGTIIIDAATLPYPAFLELSRRLTIANPKYREAQKYNRWTGNLSPTLRYYDWLSDGELAIPRGAACTLFYVCVKFGLDLQIEDETLAASPVAFPARPRLSTEQRRAVEDILRFPVGQLVAPAGSGKTIMALEAIVQRAQPTLWITHTRELAMQTRERAIQFLGLSADEIGMQGDGKHTVGSRLTIGMVQTLAKGIPEELRAITGHVVLDEAHHVPALQMASVVPQFPAKYLLGLSATPYRRDGLDVAIVYHLGPITAEMSDTDQTDRLVRPRVIRWDTNVAPLGDSFTELVSTLVRHKERNRLIVHHVTEAAKQGRRRCLVLTDRVDHVQWLTDLIANEGIAVAALHGSLSRLARMQARSGLDNGELAVIVATGHLIGEGFDSPALDTLFLATPVSWYGRLLQYLGRICRTADGKGEAVVIDYTDDHPMLWSSWSKRRDAYDAAGYRRERAA